MEKVKCTIIQNNIKTKKETRLIRSTARHDHYYGGPDSSDSPVDYKAQNKAVTHQLLTFDSPSSNNEAMNDTEQPQPSTSAVQPSTTTTTTTTQMSLSK